MNNFKETDINLIPKESSVTGNYLCTWWNQSKAAAGLGLTGVGLSEWRDALSQEAIFDADYYHILPKDLIGGLIFLLDDGWDLPLETPNDDIHRPVYGAVDPDIVKFSRFGNTPEERLKGISDKLKEMGYAGLGLWISPQESSLFEAKSAVEYWEERAKWCHNAGVLYWKVDWGAHDYDDEYRKIITEAAHRYAPGLMVEHAVVQKPCTHNNYSENFTEERAARVKYQMEFSDVYRTYDILEPFENVCTLQRAHEALLSANKEARGLGLINAENIYFIAAALGFTTGIMNNTPSTAPCIKWHRIAPPFGINESTYNFSEQRLEDSLYFETEICSWAPCVDRTVRESAPAIMARGCPLPSVKPCSNDAPYIIASKNPKTNAYSVASIRRTVDPNQAVYFLSDVTVTEADINAPIGTFGIFNSLTIEFSSPLSKKSKVIAQNLNEDTAVDITDFVTINANSIQIDGKLLRKIGQSKDPAVVIKIV